LDKETKYKQGDQSVTKKPLSSANLLLISRKQTATLPRRLIASGMTFRWGVTMKFRFILWMLGLLMARASRNNPAFQQQLAGKELTFQLQTIDGKVARHFVISGQRVRSASGVVSEPAFVIAFKDAAYGFATLQAKNKQLAFMQGIQNKDIQVTGNTGLVMWFQGLMKYLKPRKKQPAKA